MVAFRPITRTARAVAAVFIGLALLQGIAAAKAAKECTASGTPLEISFEDSVNSIEFKCSADFNSFYPADLTKVYDTEVSEATAAEPVALTSVVHKAVLTKDQASTPTYTLSVSHATAVAKETKLYYLCKKPADNSYCKVQITVKPRATKPAATCDSKTVKKILLDKTEESIQFSCGADYNTLLPAGKKQAFTAQGATPVDLVTLYPGATLEQGTVDDKVYTLRIPTRTTSKLLYFRCQKGQDDACDMEVTVEKNKAVPGTEDATCTGDKQQVELTLSAEQPGVAFTCGVDVPALDPQDLTDVYTEEAMNSKVKLSTLYQKAALYTDSSLAAYTYLLYVPQRDEGKTLYYKCKNSTTNKECKVKIAVKSNKGVVPVCKDATLGAFLSYEDFDESVKFKCDAAFPDIVPSNLAQVYGQDPSLNASAETVDLTTVYSGAKLESDGDQTSPTYTLTIPRHLPRQVKRLYYQCKNKDNTTCTVRIRVSEKMPKMITCDDTEKSLTITGPGEIVRFKCGNNLTLHPAKEEEVYDNQDGKCATAASLATLVPDASLTTDSEDGTGKRLTFAQLPTTDKALCYSCSEANNLPLSASFRAPQNTKQCKILIGVKSAAYGLNAQTLAGHALILVSLVGAVFSAL